MSTLGTYSFMFFKTFKEMQFLKTFSSVRYTALNEMEIEPRKLVS